MDLEFSGPSLRGNFAVHHFSCFEIGGGKTKAGRDEEPTTDAMDYRQKERHYGKKGRGGEFRTGTASEERV